MKYPCRPTVQSRPDPEGSAINSTQPLLRGKEVRLLACFLFALLPLAANGQSRKPPKPQELPHFELSAVALGSMELPALFYPEVAADEEGAMATEYRPLRIESGSMRSRAKVQLQQPVRLYLAKTNPTNGKVTYEPYIEVPAKSPADRLLLLFYHDEKGNLLSKFFDNSQAVHPARTVRLLNLSKHRAAFSVGGKPIVTDSGGDVHAPPVPGKDGRFEFVFNHEISGQGIHQAPARFLQFRRPGNRLLVVFTTMPFDENTGQSDAEGKAITKRTYRPEAVWLPDNIPGIKEQPAGSPPSTNS